MVKGWRVILSAVTVSTWLMGCAGLSSPDDVASAQQAVPEPAPVEQSVAVLRADAVDAAASAQPTENLTEVERRFIEGLNRYNDGNYPAAIRLFREQAFKRSWPELQIRSMKYLAFSYCVTKATVQCQATFAEILKLDPGFELTEAEAGHPIWGPVFTQAKASVTGPRKTGK